MTYLKKFLLYLYMVIILCVVNPKDINCDVCKKSKIIINYKISSHGYNKYPHVIKKDMTRILSKLMEVFPKASISFVNHFKVHDGFIVDHLKGSHYKVNTINFDYQMNCIMQKASYLIDEYDTSSSIIHYIGIRIKGKGYTLKFDEMRNIVLDAINGVIIR